MYGILMILVSSCAIIIPDITFKPKSSNGFIFPMHSPEFTKSVEDCIEQKKFPCNYPEPQDSLDMFQNRWYSKHLRSLKESKIYNQTGKGSKIIRFTCLETWGNPVSFKIEKRDDIILGTYSRTNGLGGYKAGRRVNHKKKVLKQENWNKIKLKINEIKFWEMPTHDTNLILDGAEWILEILWDDEYHFVTRSSPDVYGGKTYAELCEMIMNSFKEEN